jgi:hypothetical protein
VNGFARSQMARSMRIARNYSKALPRNGQTVYVHVANGEGSMKMFSRVQMRCVLSLLSDDNLDGMRLLIHCDGNKLNMR